jgi:calpain-7
MSWNPDLFEYKCVVHEEWKPTCTTDKYTMGYNPQYKLKITGKGSVWVMLTRHIVEHKNRNQEYLTLHVYHSDKRVYYPDKPFKRGTYSNNPHYLVSLDQDSTSVYTLVVCMRDLHLLIIGFTI